MREFNEMKSTSTRRRLYSKACRKEVVWMSHQDYVASIPEGFEIVAHTANCPVAAMQNPAKNSTPCSIIRKYHSEHGKEMIRNFLFEVCGCTNKWTMANYAQDGHCLD